MSKDLDLAIDEIRKLSPQLNEVTDEAAEVVGTVERFLNETCSIGLPVQVTVKLCPDDTKLCLEYGRVNGKFRIAVSLWGLNEDGDFARTLFRKPWLSCPRAEKLASFEALPELLEEIASEADSAVEGTASMSSTVKSVLQALKKQA